MTKNNFNLTILRKAILFFLLCGAAIAYIVLVLECFHPAIIGDETFSMALIKHSYFDIITYTARDVHPPLYYIILKFFVEFFSLFSVSAVAAGKLASAIPYFLLLIITAFYIRKQFGKLTAVIFAVCLIGMANMQNFGVQIRMYSWGMFFVTVACLSAYELLKNPDNVKYSMFFILCSLMASYTHYFACIAVASIYVTLFFWLLIKNRKYLRNWIAWVIVTCIGYLPWLIVAIRQVLTVRENYWIESISADTLLSYIQFMFNPSIYQFYSGTICGLLLLLSIPVLLFYTVPREAHVSHRDYPVAEWYFSFMGVFVPFFEIALGILASILIRPVFSQRYIFVSTGALWLGFSILIAKAVQKLSNPKTILLYLFLSFLLCVNISAFIRREEEYRDGWETCQDYLLQNLEPDDIILTNFGQVRLSMSYSYPEHKVCYYWRQKTESLFQELYGNLADTRDVETILTYLTATNAIYLVDAMELPEFHFVQDCTEKGILFDEIGSCLIEDTPVTIYRITRS